MEPGRGDLPVARVNSSGAKPRTESRRIFMLRCGFSAMGIEREITTREGRTVKGGFAEGRLIWSRTLAFIINTLIYIDKYCDLYYQWYEEEAVCTDHFAPLDPLKGALLPRAEPRRARRETCRPPWVTE